MKIKKLERKTIVEVDPGELLSVAVRTGKNFGDAIRFAVWEILKMHNKLSGPADASMVRFIDGKYEVVICGQEETDEIIEEAKKWTSSTQT